jgi:hypothetical protein
LCLRNSFREKHENLLRKATVFFCLLSNWATSLAL